MERPISLADMPSDANALEKVEWLNQHIPELILSGTPWRQDLIGDFPDYLNSPYGLGYFMHDCYLNGPIEAYDRAVDIRRDIVAFGLPDDIELESPSGRRQMARETFLADLADAVRQEPSLKFQSWREPESKSWRTAMGNRGLMISEEPVVRAFRAWLTQRIFQYRQRLVDLEYHLVTRLTTHGANLRSMWGLVTQRQGFEVPHIHRDGFISGVFYVNLPREITEAAPGEQPGWLRFGESLIKKTPPHPRQITLRPTAGCLFVFPGYIPHRILEFDPSVDERICISFDAG